MISRLLASMADFEAIANVAAVCSCDEGTAANLLQAAGNDVQAAVGRL